MATLQKVKPEEIIVEVNNICRTDPIFSGMAEQQINNFASRAANQAQIILRGDPVVRQNEQDRQFFLVVRGELAAYDDTADTRRLLNYLGAGTFFGFRTLLDRDGKRSATVEAVVDSLVVFFSEDDWRWLTNIHPEAEEQVKKLEGKFEEQGRLSFRGKHADEITFRIARRHYLAFLRRLTVPTVLLIAPVLVLIIAELVGIGTAAALQSWLVWALILPFLVLSLLLTIYHYFDWRNDEFIVTSKRVIHIERILFYSEERQEAPLTQIQSVTVQTHNWLDVIFDVDDIVIQTAAIGKMFINNLQAAQDISREILRAQVAAKQRATAYNSSRTRQQLKERLNKNIMAEGLPPAAEPKVVRRRFPINNMPKLNLGYFVPRIKETKDKKITWRKHPFILIKNIFLPLLAVIGSGYLVLAMLFGFWPFAAPAAWFLTLMILALFGGCFFWYTHRYDAWRRDIYILTDTKIIDVESSAFKLKGEQVREGSFDSIQSITYNIPSWWEQLINLGDVVIKTAGAQGDFTFKRVFNPSSVQETIFYRWDRFQDEKRQKAQESSNLQTIEIVGQYDDLQNSR